MEYRKLLGLCFCALVVILVFQNASADAVLLAKKIMNMQPVALRSMTRYSKYEAKQVPKKFEIVNDDYAPKMFESYVHDIKEMMSGSNVTYLYKINVEPMTEETYPKKTMKKKLKKYQVPLKKQSMHLSNNELVMKRLVEQQEESPQNTFANVSATTGVEEFRTTRTPHAGKYKPLLSKIYRIKNSQFGSKPVKSLVSTIVSKN